MIYNIVNHNKKEDVKKAEPTAQQKSAADNDPDRFQKLLNNREKSLAQEINPQNPRKARLMYRSLKLHRQAPAVLLEKVVPVQAIARKI